MSAAVCSAAIPNTITSESILVSQSENAAPRAPENIKPTADTSGSSHGLRIINQ